MSVRKHFEIEIDIMKWWLVRTKVFAVDTNEKTFELCCCSFPPLSISFYLPLFLSVSICPYNCVMACTLYADQFPVASEKMRPPTIHLVAIGDRPSNASILLPPALLRHTPLILTRACEFRTRIVEGFDAASPWSFLKSRLMPNRSTCYGKSPNWQKNL